LRRRASIVATVPLLMAGLGALLVAWTFYASISNGNRRVLETARREALLVSQVAAGILERDFASGRVDALRITLTEIRADRTVRLAVLADESNRIVAATDFALEGQALSAAGATFDQLAANSRRTSTMATRVLDEGRRLATSQPVPLATAGPGLLTVGEGVLVVDRDLRGPLADAMDDARATALRSAVLLAALCFTAWGVLHVVLVRRVRRLVDATHALATGSLEATDLLAGDDEIGQAAHALSAMARQRQRLEERVSQAQKMQAIGTLAGGIAHDFNNLLTAIVGYAELAAESAPAGETGDLIGEIRTAADRGVLLTRQLLTFSRQDLGMPEVIQAGAAVEGTERLLRQLLRANIQLRLDAPPGAGAVLLGQGQLEQILVNLAVNARDAMPDGGALDIQLREATADETGRDGVPAGRWVMLGVRDSGVGMTEATRARVFEPFFTTKPRGKGTGLGLSTVYWIVARHQGHIRVTSAAGAGSEFRIYLPQADGVPVERVAASRASRPPSFATGATILLVEDEDAVRRMAAHVLRQHGYQVLAAADASEALEHWRTRRADIDLLLTDIVMPGMAGNVLAGQLQADVPPLPVVYMSGYTDEPEVQAAISGGRAAFLAKPFTPAELLQAIEAEIARP
jgi:signal transduction histidine kinase